RRPLRGLPHPAAAGPRDLGGGGQPRPRPSGRALPGVVARPLRRRSAGDRPRCPPQRGGPHGDRRHAGGLRRRQPALGAVGADPRAGVQLRRQLSAADGPAAAGNLPDGGTGRGGGPGEAAGDGRHARQPREGGEDRALRGPSPRRVPPAVADSSGSCGLRAAHRLRQRGEPAAGPRRRQLLTESLVLSLGGAIAGIGFAYLGLRGLVAISPASVPRLGEAGIDGAALAFALGLGLAASLLSGLVPALRTARPDLQTLLKEGGRSFGAGSARDRVRTSLLVAEVALALVLLAGAGLLIRSAI